MSKILFVSERLELDGDDQYELCCRSHSVMILVSFLDSGGRTLVTDTLSNSSKITCFTRKLCICAREIWFSHLQNQEQQRRAPSC